MLLTYLYSCVERQRNAFNWGNLIWKEKINLFAKLTKLSLNLFYDQYNRLSKQTVCAAIERSYDNFNLLDSKPSAKIKVCVYRRDIFLFLLATLSMLYRFLTKHTDIPSVSIYFCNKMKN